LKQQCEVPVKPQERQITSCRARGEQHARPSHKHCKPCAKHARAPPPRACTRLRDFHLVEFSHQPVPVPVKQQVETTVCGETSRTKITRRVQFEHKKNKIKQCTSRLPLFVRIFKLNSP
jgi:hypothetical protein